MMRTPLRTLTATLICGSTATAQMTDPLWHTPGAMVQQDRDFSNALPLFECLERECRPRSPTFLVVWACAEAWEGSKDGAYVLLEQALSEGYVSTTTMLEDLPSFAGEALMDDPRWEPFVRRMRLNETAALAALDPESNNLGPNPSLAAARSLALDPQVSPTDLHRRLTNWNDFPRPKAVNTWVRLSQRVTQDLALPYYVYIPSGYDCAKPTPLVVYFRGGIGGRKVPMSESTREFEFSENPALNFARRERTLLLYPTCQDDTLWWSPAGRAVFQKGLAEVRRRFNIDDNRVWLMGHSDGGTSVLAIAQTNPTNISAIFPISGYWFPQPMLPNLRLRPVFAMSGAADDWYPIDEARGQVAFANTHGADILLREAAGGTHALASMWHTGVPVVLDRMKRTARPPVPRSIEWHWRAATKEPTSVEWLRLDALDESMDRALWHEVVKYQLVTNPAKPPSDMTYGDKMAIIRASVQGNTFTVETSRVRRFTIRLHPELVDLSAPVRVVVNGHEAFNSLVTMDKRVMTACFEETMDRGRVWAAEVPIDVVGG